MGGDETAGRQCPHCREYVHAEAVVCKHCGSRLTPETPPHGGTCPYCKEEINPEATKCKHCGSFVGAERAAREAAGSGCGCGGGGEGRSRRDFGLRGEGGYGYDPQCVDQCVWQCALYGYPVSECYPFCARLCSQPHTLPRSLR
jgi:hypothetical protein